MPMVVGEPEVMFLRKFFDEVDHAVTNEMQAGKSLLEENLTFVLARLLDGESTFQRMLNYSIQDLNSDLERCATGTQISIEFETNEHKRYFESTVSHADLGIVLRREGSILNPEYTKAIIVQSKKLYPVKTQYSLFSQYGGFDGNQFLALKKIASDYSWNGVIYFLYNPRLEAFSEEEAKILRALESRLLSFPMPFSRNFFWHPEMEYFLEKATRRGGGFLFGVGGSEIETKSPDELLEQRKKAIEFKPGLRVIGISDLSAIVGKNDSIRSSFHLEECYRHVFSDRWWGNSGTVPFLPLSSFIVDLFMGCGFGSDNQNLIRIAAGLPPNTDDDFDAGNNSDNENGSTGIAVKHTLRITVKNTLPEKNMMFHQRGW
ncbi:MAG: hypothetical protein ACM3SY_13745 [Candidatus Omnitrophota bacterium]